MLNEKPLEVMVDFEDVKTVMSEPGKAMMGIARSQSASAKVEALSSNGMDEIEIPAFLR